MFREKKTTAQFNPEPLPGPTGSRASLKQGTATHTARVTEQHHLRSSCSAGQERRGVKAKTRPSPFPSKLKHHLCVYICPPPDFTPRLKSAPHLRFVCPHGRVAALPSRQGRGAAPTLRGAPGAGAVGAVRAGFAACRGLRPGRREGGRGGRSAAMGKRVALVLAGCGVFDGSEIHEASAALVHLSRGGAEVGGRRAPLLVPPRGVWSGVWQAPGGGRRVCPVALRLSAAGELPPPLSLRPVPSSGAGCPGAPPVSGVGAPRAAGVSSLARHSAERFEPFLCPYLGPSLFLISPPPKDANVPLTGAAVACGRLDPGEEWQEALPCFSAPQPPAGGGRWGPVKTDLLSDPLSRSQALALARVHLLVFCQLFRGFFSNWETPGSGCGGDVLWSQLWLHMVEGGHLLSLWSRAGVSDGNNSTTWTKTTPIFNSKLPSLTKAASTEKSVKAAKQIGKNILCCTPLLC